MIVERCRVGFTLDYICAQTDMILAYYTECSRIDKYMCYYMYVQVRVRVQVHISGCHNLCVHTRTRVVEHNTPISVLCISRHFSIEVVYLYYDTLRLYECVTVYFV